MKFKTFEELQAYKKEILENSIFSTIRNKDNQDSTNGNLSYYERISLRCQPHEALSLDWKTYYSIDFADRFLPKADLFECKGVRFYDGAEILEGCVPSPRKLLVLNDNNKLVSIVVYSFSDNVSASLKKDKVKPSSFEVCVFVEIDQNENANVSFKFGSDFRTFLEKQKLSPSQIQNQSFKSDKSSIQSHFNKTLSHDNMMSFILKKIGVDVEKVYGNSEKGKLKTYLRDNNIESFIYKNKCSKDKFIAVQGTIINGWLELKRIDYTEIDKITSLGLSSKESFLLFKQKGVWSETGLTIPIDYNDGNCIENETLFDDSEIKHISEQVKEHYKFTNLKGNEKQFHAINNQIAKKLSNPFYSNINLCISLSVDDSNIKKSENKLLDGPNFNTSSLGITNEKYTNTFTRGDGECEIGLDIRINQNGEVSIKHNVSPKYLQEFTSKWQEEIKRRGLEKHIDIEELRQQVIADFTHHETEKNFYQTFIQDAKALLDENIGGYVEAIQATQKVAKNVWSDGAVNESTWLKSVPDHKEWPQYMQLQPLLGGGTDGVIDEIAGIPMAIKGIYGIATDENQREALLNLFTKEGASQLIDGLKEEAKQTVNDDDRLQHFSAKTTVSVGASLLGIGLFTKTGKVGKVLDSLVDKVKDYVNPKVLEYIDQIKKGNRHVDTDEALSKLSKEIGDDLFEETIIDVGETAVKKGKKLTIEELQAFWKRGNDFNAKSKLNLWYKHNELWLEHPTKKYPKGHKNAGKPRKFRVDSYDTSGKGKIVSRKATDLNEIEFSTFQRYCKEIKEKYPIGSKIARKEDGLGDVLKGEFYLEIPESNKSFKKMDEYIKFARELDPPVIIIFKPE